MKNREQSRQQWQQEIWERQLNVTDDQTLRALHHVAKAPVSETFTTKQMLLGVMASVVGSFGVAMFFWPFAFAPELGAVTIGCGILLLWAAVRARSRRGKKL